PAFVLQQLYSRAFFARQDTRSPMRFALVSIAVNIVVGIALFQLIGIRGIAAATALASWLNVAQSAWKLHRLGEYRPSAVTWSRLARLLAASLLLGGLLALASHYRAVIEAPLSVIHIGGKTMGGKEIALGLIAAGAGLLYPVLVIAFGGLKISEIRSFLRRGKPA
ncbi:MAG: integral rane protein MviN, partial [Caulobacter sp.]|nr:integral rane protein MviN [Caulobacter sp.]